MPAHRDLTELHREALESHPEIERLRGVYSTTEGVLYITFLDPTGKDRSRGYTKTLLECGVEVDPKHNIECGICKTTFVSHLSYQKYCSKPCRDEGTRQKARVSERKRLYGLSTEDFDRMVSEQEGKCWFCKRVPEYELVVDHCHTTGRTRRLLCIRCNSCLGWYEEFATQAREYLDSN